MPSPKCGGGGAHGAARAVGHGLDGELDAVRQARLERAVGAADDDDPAGAGLAGRGHGPGHERPPAEVVQDLGQARAHARALAGGQDDDDGIGHSWGARIRTWTRCSKGTRAAVTPLPKQGLGDSVTSPQARSAASSGGTSGSSASARASAPEARRRSLRRRPRRRPPGSPLGGAGGGRDDAALQGSGRPARGPPGVARGQARGGRGARRAPRRRRRCSRRPGRRVTASASGARRGRGRRGRRGRPGRRDRPGPPWPAAHVARGGRRRRRQRAAPSAALRSSSAARRRSRALGAERARRGSGPGAAPSASRTTTAIAAAGGFSPRRNGSRPAVRSAPATRGERSGQHAGERLRARPDEPHELLHRRRLVVDAVGVVGGVAERARRAASASPASTVSGPAVWLTAVTPACLRASGSPCAC